MISYVTLTTTMTAWPTVQKQTNFVLNQFPLLKGHIIDVTEDADRICFKLLVCAARTIDDYEILSKRLHMQIHLASCSVLLNDSSINVDSMVKNLIENTASLCYIYDYARGRDYGIIAYDPKRVTRQCLRASTEQFDKYLWIYKSTEQLLKTNNKELSDFLDLIQNTRKSGIALAAYTGVMLDREDAKGYLPMRPRYETGYFPTWDSQYLAKKSTQTDMRLIHMMELETLVYNTCTPKLIYTYPGSRIYTECVNYDRISNKHKCMDPVRKLWYRLQYAGWGMNKVYIIQKPVDYLELVLQAGVGSILVFICNDEIMTQWIMQNSLQLNNRTDCVVVIIAKEDGEILSDLTSCLSNCSIFDGEQCSMAPYENTNDQDIPLIQINADIKLNNSAVSSLLKEVFYSNEEMQVSLESSKTEDYRTLYTQLSDVPNNCTALTPGYNPTQMKRLLQMAMNLPAESAQHKITYAIGQPNARKYIQKSVNCCTYEASRNHTQINANCVAFIGNHGCGKTYYALLTAELFSQNNITTAIDKSYAILNASMLVGTYQGSTSANTRDIFAKNSKRTLIIENPSVLLQHNDYGRQAIAEVIYQMEQLTPGAAVIITDTKDGYAALLEEYPSLEMSLDTIEFDDYNRDELLDIYLYYLEHNYHYTVDNFCTASLCLKSTLESITGDRNANGALVENAKFAILAAKETVLAHSKNHQDQNRITDDNVRSGFNAVLDKYKSGKIVFNTEFSFRTETETSFKNVIGNSAAMSSLKRIVEYLRNPEAYTAVGAHFPNGILLAGAPGTGKTLMARALANEAQIPFCYVSGSSFVQKYVGEGARKIRNLFKEARKRGKCIIFIDEIDSIGSTRGAEEGSRETERTLNQLLTEMDGFSSSKDHIFVLAATNLASKLDKALLRPGRFDEVISVQLPTKGERVELFKSFADECFNVSDDQYQILADLTSGCSGADIYGIVAKARLLSGEQKKTNITYAELSTAASDSLLGHTQEKVCNANERERVAYHEAGHALLTRLHKGSGSVHKVSILPHSNGSLGLSWQHSEQKNLHTKSDLLNEVDILLAGHCAESYHMHSTSTGVSDDLSRATSILQDMICKYGMYPEFWLQSTQTYSQDSLVRIERVINAELKDALTRVNETLCKHEMQLNRIAQTLLLKEEIDGSFIDSLF